MRRADGGLGQRRRLRPDRTSAARVRLEPWTASIGTLAASMSGVEGSGTAVAGPPAVGIDSVMT